MYNQTIQITYLEVGLIKFKNSVSIFCYLKHFFKNCVPYFCSAKKFIIKDTQRPLQYPPFHNWTTCFACLYKCILHLNLSLGQRDKCTYRYCFLGFSGPLHILSWLPGIIHVVSEPMTYVSSLPLRSSFPSIHGGFGKPSFVKYGLGLLK